MRKSDQKYFERYAERETRELARRIESQKFDEVVVVPARQEFETFPNLLRSIESAARSRRILVILVVNASSESPESVVTDNAKLLKAYESHSEVFAIDSKAENVGRARKLGCDLAAFLILNRQIQSPFIYSTDADAIVPSDYFDQIPNPSSSVAYIFPFSHTPASEEPNQKIATKVYELFMAYYRGGLEFAGSPFAFHTIGSTLAIRSHSYIDVRGFPARDAGEDFYLLNKLRKLGPVKELTSKPIILSGRLSDRVPFGTGASIRRYLTELESNRDILFYDPEVFWTLKTLLESFDVLDRERSLKIWHEALLNDERRGPWVLRILQDWNAFEEISKVLLNAKDKTSLQVEILTWFDGFKTLKFIHQVRDHYLPSIPWFEAVQLAPFDTTGRRTANPISPWTTRRQKR